MPQNVLTAIIGADGSQFTKTLSQLEKQLKAFENALSLPRSTESFNRLNRAADATRQRIAALKGLGNPLSAVKGGADASTQSLINLGRVVQDAPFGFLGIANNLNPLIEGFSRSTKAAGGFGGAVKGLGKSLLGAGGLSLGVSLISTGLILFGDKLFGASKETKALDEAIGNLSKSVADDAAKLTTIVGLILNTNTAQEDRAKAIKAVNQEYGALLKNMGIEEVTLGNIKTAYDKVIDSLLRQAVVKGLQEQISAAVAETAKTIITMQTAEENRRLKSEKAAKAQKNQLTEEQRLRKNAEQELSFYNQTARDGNLALLQREQTLDGTFKAENTFESALQKVKDQLREQLSPLLNLTTKFEDLGITLNKGGKEANGFVEKAKRMAAFLDKNTQFSVTFEVDPSDTPEATLKKAKEFLAKAEKFINTGLPPFKFKPLVLTEFGFKLNPEMFKEISQQAGIEANRTYIQVKKAFEDNIKKLAESNPIVIDVKSKIKEFSRDEVLRLGGSVKINADFEPRFDAQGNFRTSVDQALASINNEFIKIVGDFQNQLGSAIGEGIGAALSGGGFGDIFKGVFNAVGGALQQLGQALIATAIGLKAIKAAFKTLNPAVALGAGIGLIALGAVIKNTVGNIAGFRAAGGPVAGGKSYVVGEKGPEIFVPNTGGNIIPNNQIRAGSGLLAASSPAIQLSGDFRISRNDLVLFINQAIASQRRNY
jgi:hypothetical protein